MNATRRHRTRLASVPRLAVALCLGVALGACGEDATTGHEGSSASESKVPENAIEQTHSAEGVTATVTVSPAEPRLGDSVRLALEVSAEADVSVTMPAFGDQLGRFPISSFVPVESRDPATGRATYAQRYQLDLPMSGRQRIPGLLVELVDASGERDEILTDEVVLEVEPISAEEVATLRPPRGPLEPLPAKDFSSRAWLWWLVSGGVVLVGLGLGLVWLGRRTRRELARDPHDVAEERLAALEGADTPDDAAAIDAWWVELSAVVRRFVEARFGLRAPELTTEEFLRTARESDALDPSQRELLASLLDLADRVKFAGYTPDATQGQDAVSRARRFVADARREAEVVLADQPQPTAA